MATAIPLVLAMTFVGMMLAGIGLQRISLGALIIALGLLVDDAMIAVETMVSRLEAGDSRRLAATYAFKTTAFPMLTGTLVMIAGFIPVGFAASSAGEYCLRARGCCRKKSDITRQDREGSRAGMDGFYAWRSATVSLPY